MEKTNKIQAVDIPVTSIKTINRTNTSVGVPEIIERLQ